MSSDSVPTPETRPWLHRGRLRDVVIVLCVASAVFYPLSTSALSISLALLAVGCAAHLLAKGQLVRNVALSTEGAYALVRHPYYLANYLIDTSFCLASGNVVLVLLYPVLFFWAYGPTLAEEESRLAALHGEAFAKYCKAVPQLFPGPGSLRAFRTIGQGFSWQRVTAQEVKRLFRFACVGLLLPLVHEASARGVADLMFWRSHNVKVAVFAPLCLACLLGAIFVARGRDRQPARSGS